MKKQAFFSRGFTLVELIVTMLVGSIFVLIVGTLLVTSFQQSAQTAQRIELENDFTYFRRSLEYQFHHTTKEGVINLFSTNLVFASLTPTGGLVINNYGLDGSNNLSRAMNDASYSGSSLVIGANQPTQIMAPSANVVSVQFVSANENVAYYNSCIQVTVVLQAPLPGGSVYTSSNTFIVTNWAGRL